MTVVAEVPLTPSAARLDWRARARAVTEPESLFDLALSVTLLLLILYGSTHWYVRAPLAVAGVLGWLWRDALRMPRFWLCVTAIVAAGVFLNRLTADNHKYLMVYWAAAIWLSLEGGCRPTNLRVNARLLIGLVFGFAVGQKLASPDFLSGAFMRYELLIDPRFEWFTRLMTGLSAETLEANRAALDSFRGLTTFSTEAAIAGNAATASLATFLTWFTLVIEAWIAVAFLVPARSVLGRSRDIALLAFVFSTYAVATVPGFAYLLIAMGLAQCDRERAYAAWGYLGAAIVIQLYLTPLGAMATDWISR